MLLRRSHDISRLEAFSDAVFAFALTLVVALEVPKSYDEFLGRHVVSAAVGLLALGIALFGPKRYGFVSPMSFALMGPAHWAYQAWADRKRKRFEAKLTTESNDAAVPQS